MGATPTDPSSHPISTDAAGSPAAPSGTHSPAASVDPSALRAELVTARLEAAGVDAAYLDMVAPLFDKTGKEPSKDAVAEFVGELKRSKPALFGPVPGQTAPTPSRSVPSAPAPGAAVTAFQQWQALDASGDRAASEAFYRLNRQTINRTAR